MNPEDIFGKTIHAYTRAMALDDGNLIDVSATAAGAGGARRGDYGATLDCY